MLVLAPVMCILGGIAVSSSLSTYMKYLDTEKVTNLLNSPDSFLLLILASPRLHLLPSASFQASSNGVANGKAAGHKGGKFKSETAAGPKKEGVAMVFVGMMTFFLISYTFHCTWVTSEAYSSPSIVLSARSHDGSRIIFDDFRESYWWLRMNTPEDAKVIITIVKPWLTVFLR